MALCRWWLLARPTVQLAGGDTVYRSEPIPDAPSGFALATNGPRFAAATSGERTAALVALTEIQNPLLCDTGDIRSASRVTWRRT
jgi:hypothetical protein